MITVRVEGGLAHTYADDEVASITRADFGRPEDISVSRRPIRLHRPRGSPWWVLDNLSSSHPLEVLGHPGPQVVSCGESIVVRRPLTVVIRGFRDHVVRIRPADSGSQTDDPVSRLTGEPTFPLGKRVQLGPRQRLSVAAFLIAYFRDFPDWRADPLTYEAAKQVVVGHPEVDLTKIKTLNVKRNVERVAEKVEENGFDLRGDDRGRRLASLAIGRRLITEDDYEVIAGRLHVRLPEEMRAP